MRCAQCKNPNAKIKVWYLVLDKNSNPLFQCDKCFAMYTKKDPLTRWGMPKKDDDLEFDRARTERFAEGIRKNRKKEAAERYLDDMPSVDNWEKWLSQKELCPKCSANNLSVIYFMLCAHQCPIVLCIDCFTFFLISHKKKKRIRPFSVPPLGELEELTEFTEGILALKQKREEWVGYPTLSEYRNKPKKAWAMQTCLFDNCTSPFKKDPLN